MSKTIDSLVIPLIVQIITLIKKKCWKSIKLYVVT